MFNYTKEELRQTGIYKITCINNNKIYIGSACATKDKSRNKNKVGFIARWKGHLYKLRVNKHRNPYLQNCYNQYGENSFKFEILEFCLVKDAIEKEEYYIELYKSYDNEIGFNVIRKHLANYTYGEKRTKMKEKLSLLFKGKKRPIELIKKWSNEVQQINMENEVVATYYSMCEAERQTGISRQDIGQSIIGRKMNKAGGFYWKKVKDIV